MNWVAVVMVILVQFAIAGVYMVRLNAYDHGKTKSEPDPLTYIIGIWVVAGAALISIAVGL